MRQVSQPVRRLQRLLPAHLHLVWGDGVYHLSCFACGGTTIFSGGMRAETVLACARTHTCPNALDRPVTLAVCPQCMLIQPDDLKSCVFCGYTALRPVPDDLHLLDGFDLPEPFDPRD